MIRLVWIVAAALAGLSGLLYSLVIQTACAGTPACRSSCCCSPRSPSVASAPPSARSSGRSIIGLVVELAPVLGVPGDLKYASALLILILLLLVRPQGLLGRAERVG